MSMDLGGVVVTGASSGIGRATARHLDKLGFHVFATVRKEADAEALRAEGSERLQPVMLEITDAENRARAVKEIEAAMDGEGLVGLVNNAAELHMGPLEFIDLDKLRRSFEVNAIGPVALCQSFLPLLRKGRGRIVNVGSIAGKMAVAFFGPLVASKFALEALNDALRLELHRFGIEVVMIEPAFVKTLAHEDLIRRGEDLLTEMSNQEGEYYAESFRHFFQSVVEEADSGVPAQDVAEVIVEALTIDKPSARYTVGVEAGLMAALVRMAPDSVLDIVRRRALHIE